MLFPDSLYYSPEYLSKSDNQVSRRVFFEN